MKTTSRKRLLVSSVAMLLVAMLALGTATYAWFTQNTTATADGIYAKTVKASSLLISDKDTGNWGTSVTYNQGTNTAEQTMFPASSGTGQAWFTATSDNEMTGAFETGKITSATPASSNAKYVFKNMLNVKNGGDEGTINDISITFNLGSITASQYARVALVPCTQAGVDLTSASFEGQKIGFTNSVFDTDNEAYEGLTGTDGSTAPITASSTCTVDVGSLTAGQARYYNLYIWFEGQDEQCIDSNAGQTIKGLEFTVSGTPA